VTSLEKTDLRGQQSQSFESSRIPNVYPELGHGLLLLLEQLLLQLLVDLRRSGERGAGGRQNGDGGGYVHSAPRRNEKRNAKQKNEIKIKKTKNKGKAKQIVEKIRVKKQKHFLSGKNKTQRAKLN
jgi:hypothetical protein